MNGIVTSLHGCVLFVACTIRNPFSWVAFRCSEKWKEGRFDRKVCLIILLEYAYSDAHSVRLCQQVTDFVPSNFDLDAGQDTTRCRNTLRFGAEWKIPICSSGVSNVVSGWFDSLPTTVHVKDAGFDCDWTVTEDASLLRGVYKYGVGSWDAIRMDPELGLSDVRFICGALWIWHRLLIPIGLSYCSYMPRGKLSLRSLNHPRM